MNDTVNLFWFRRDLRLNDNRGLFEALKSGRKVLPVFIFDKEIFNKPGENDQRVLFIYKTICRLNEQLSGYNTSISVFYGFPAKIFAELIHKYQIDKVYTNHDYEPYTIQRDKQIADLLEKNGSSLLAFKDQVLFEAGEILKPDGKPYVVFTPYSRKWLNRLHESEIENFRSESMTHLFVRDVNSEMPSLLQMGFRNKEIIFPENEIPEHLILNYQQTRNYPGLDGTSRLGLHLRFGTISIRECIRIGKELSPTWLNELIWREFFMQILAFFPHVVRNSFKPEYDKIQWVNNELHFKCWCDGTTGFPLVDAGMRELSLTGFMHNRVRMVVAGFLVKHLLIDWRWGEAWFAEKLLDFELSSNNGNWQWAAGCGCDATPYFRIFNPVEQAKKFDAKAEYIKKWVQEYDTPSYPKPIIDLHEARKRCLRVYQTALKG